ncbi:tetraspanin-18-like [Hetaerina americana]|uniref:tetraspanin-18-like n=1 Tax=Hetaerina americana TaxID=62018 RepID=UPI003A7F5552
MPLDCGAWLAKYILCLFNFIFFLAGTAVLSIGIWLAADKNSFISFTQSTQNPTLQQFGQQTVVDQAAYVLIAIGAFIFIVSFLGYCGAIRESKCMLMLYAVFLFLILILEVTAGGLVVGYRKEAEDKTRDFFKSTIKDYYAPKDKEDAVTLMWNYLMSQMSCCGVDNYQDFQTSEKWRLGSKKVPEACCVLVPDGPDPSLFKPRDPDCPKNPSATNSYYETGCYQVFLNWVNERTDIVLGVVIGLVLIQIIGICLSCCLYRVLESYIK